MYDLVIRGGSIIDGLGGPARDGDIAIQDGRIVAIGKLGDAAARQTIDATGAIVTPGFVDLHSHYDGQLLWDDLIDPSFSHGVTTTIAGNCGVGVAPVNASHRGQIIDFMTGVESIPEIVLEEGLDWNWRSFTDYLDRIGERKYAMDVGVHIPHGPLRLFVMGDRALRHEEATAEDIEKMCQLVREAMAAGAAGFSTGRVMEHRAKDGNAVPGTFALDEEVIALSKAMAEGGRGVVQVAPRGELGTTFRDDGSNGREGRMAEHLLMEKIAEACGRPVNYGVLEVSTDDDDANIMIAACDRAIARGVPVYPMISPRGAGLIFMIDGYHIFMLRPSYREVAHLPLPARLEALRDPARRAAILSEGDTAPEAAKAGASRQLLSYITANLERSFILRSPLDFEPGVEETVGARAKAAGQTPEEFLYDFYVTGDGSNFNVNLVANYNHGNLDSTRVFMMNPNVITGLADGGAHLKSICDAAMPTFQLAYWTRERTRGDRVSLPLMVHKLTAVPAALYGFTDRGTLEVGKRADINVIDYERLTLKMPRMVHDLPSGSGRILQESVGYLATLVAGVPTRLNDKETGARPGRLFRTSSLAPSRIEDSVLALA